MQGLGKVFRSLSLGIILAGAFAFTSQDAVAQPPVEQPEIFRGINSPTYLWEPVSGRNPKAIILGLHGAVLHGRSYKALASDLAEQDIMFASLDMRGYGKWKYDQFGSKSDAKVKYKESMADAKAMLLRLRHRYPDAPIICLGESLGSHVAFKMASEEPSLVDGVIAASPFSNLKAFLSPRLLLNAAQVLSNPVSKLNLEPYLDERLSNKPQEVETQFADPYNRNKQSAGELLQSLIITVKGKRAAFKLPVSMPVLVVVGDEDNLAGYTGTVKKFHKMKGTNKHLAVLHGSGHLIFESSEPENRAVDVVTNFVADVSSGRIAVKPSTDVSHIASKTAASSADKAAQPSTVSIARSKTAAENTSLQ